MDSLWCLQEHRPCRWCHGPRQCRCSPHQRRHGPCQHRRSPCQWGCSPCQWRRCPHQWCGSPCQWKHGYCQRCSPCQRNDHQKLKHDTSRLQMSALLPLILSDGTRSTLGQPIPPRTPLNHAKTISGHPKSHRHRSLFTTRTVLHR